MSASISLSLLNDCAKFKQQPSLAGLVQTVVLVPVDRTNYTPIIQPQARDILYLIILQTFSYFFQIRNVEKATLNWQINRGHRL